MFPQAVHDGGRHIAAWGQELCEMVVHNATSFGKVIHALADLNKDMAIMGEVMKLSKGKADPKVASQLLTKLLNQ